MAGLSAAEARDSGVDGARPQAAEHVVAEDAPPAGLWTASNALHVGILKDITARKSKARDPDLSSWLDELGTLYAADFQGPLWLDGDRLSQRARNALAELRRAGEWGLEPAEYDIGIPIGGFYDDAERARFEVDFTLNLLKYVDHARRGRFRPTEISLWYERASNKTDHMDLLRRIARTESPEALLAAQHPQHEGFKLLRQAYLQRVFPDRFSATNSEVVDTAPKPVVLDYGEPIRRGQRHPQIALLRERLKVPAATAAEEDLYDRALMTAVNEFMRTQGWRRKNVYDDKVRQALNEASGTKARSKSRITTADLVANMEKWRWLPRDLGDIYVWNNLPSFKTQVVKNGRVIHEERIIIGKSKTQTPVFSDTMTHVVFKPQWGVPGSIKIRSLLPRLAAGDLDVLRRRGMRVQYGDKVVSPGSINWSRTDIQTIPIVMGAGSSNPLGRVKFMFPNHHDVYMHDTPDRHLFNDSERLFSHGCIRVRDPIRFAEIILGESSNWKSAQVEANLQGRALENHRVDLDRTVSVHNTYFTVIAAADGKFDTLPDIYGHDRRIKEALDGKSLSAIASNDPARLHKREIEQLANAPRPVYVASQDNYDPQPSYGIFGGVYQPEPYALGGPGYYAAPKKPNKKKKSSHNWSMNPYQNYFQGN
ncbi:MAG: L,D-transpeptidase family protein [Alphaproteobacteria bacterium]|nr:L,D-transpeptidase family protein [Alphaproteobacteria bacterium]